VISESHNPYADNGSSSSLPVARRCPIGEQAGRSGARAAPETGSFEPARQGACLDDARGRYIEFCKRTFSNEHVAEGAEDRRRRANGARYHIAPDVFTSWGERWLPRCSHETAQTSMTGRRHVAGALIAAVKSMARYGRRATSRDSGLVCGTRVSPLPSTLTV